MLAILAVKRKNDYVGLVLHRIGVVRSLPLYSCGGYRRWSGGIRTLEVREGNPHGGMWTWWDAPTHGKPTLASKEIYIAGTNLSALDTMHRGADHRLNIPPFTSVSLPAWVLSDLALSGFKSSAIAQNTRNQSAIKIFPPSRKPGVVMSSSHNQTSTAITFRCSEEPDSPGPPESFQLLLSMDADGHRLQASVAFPSSGPARTAGNPAASISDTVASWTGGTRTFHRRDATTGAATQPDTGLERN